MNRFACISLLVLSACSEATEESWARLTVSPNIEDKLGDTRPYTPSTQSFLRGHHDLEKVHSLDVALGADDLGSLRLSSVDQSVSVRIRGISFAQLVPRLEYSPASPPDAFDAFNLRMAEFARNGLSVPTGKAGDTMAHFESDLEGEVPWSLDGDYGFVPNPRYRPVRMSVTNNCLRAGLWELGATDRAGEIYHAWYELDLDRYYGLVARTTGISPSFVKEALAWSLESPLLDLERLRDAAEDFGRVDARFLTEGKSGYSTQDSRRKLAKGYAMVGTADSLRIPSGIADLTSGPVHLSSFIEPGKYSLTERRQFDFGFLRELRSASVQRTHAKTRYRGRVSPLPQANSLEIRCDLGEWQLVLGNLPIELLVPQEDFAIWGFGVGILSSSGFAERRSLLIEHGPAPSFAFLARVDTDGLKVVNSHEFGLEQVFIRTHVEDAQPWFEVTLTSYERIVDVARWRIDVPAGLVDTLREGAARYVAPAYRNYRDDNLR